jgi:hypothetical protein
MASSAARSVASSSAAVEQEAMLMPGMYSVWQAVERKVL